MSEQAPPVFSRQLAYNQKFQINQAVEKRSGLLFNYGGTDRSKGEAMKRWLPFYETNLSDYLQEPTPETLK